MFNLRTTISLAAIVASNIQALAETVDLQIVEPFWIPEDCFVFHEAGETKHYDE